MHLVHLSLTNFRNFTRLDVDVPGQTVLLVGGNAQGKTSLLEAVYFLATLDSFHASSDRQLINFLEARKPLAVARIVAEYCRERKNHRLEVRIIQEVDAYQGSSRVRKEVLVDGGKVKASQALGQFNAVLFLPQMMSIIDGAPEERRRYLNLALAQVISYYPAALNEYNRALAQRNALLKQLGEREGDPQQLVYWDELLVQTGSQLLHARIRAVQEIEYLAALIHRDLTRGEEVLRLSYQPAYDPLPNHPNQYSLPLDAPVDRMGFSLDQIRSGFLDRLVQLRGEEIERGVTTIGPHRDELRFLSNGVDLGTYGSRGQVRTAMLALKMAEVAWMKDKTGEWPVLLLDEVLAELDANRRIDLLNRLVESEQALLTTTDLDLFSEAFTQRSTRWHIQGGRLTEELRQGSGG